MPAPQLMNYAQDLTTVNFTEEMIQHKLEKLLPNKSPGPDGYHPRVLKELAKSLAQPLKIIFELSMTENDFPEEWRLAHITALHKKGSRKQPGNYKPVSLIAVISKVIESTVRDTIVEHMLENDLFRFRTRKKLPDSIANLSGRLDIFPG